jgi:hypothetical protein
MRHACLSITGARGVAECDPTFPISTCPAARRNRFRGSTGTHLLGLGEVLFAIQPLPFDFFNWDIHPHPPTLREEERNALETVSRELREKQHYLLLINVPSPYAA